MKSSVLPSSETANELQNIEKSLLELVTKPPCGAQSSYSIPVAGTSKPLRLEQREEQFPLCGLGSWGLRHLRDIELLCNFWIQHYQSLKQVLTGAVFMRVVILMVIRVVMRVFLRVVTSRTSQVP